MQGNLKEAPLANSSPPISIPFSKQVYTELQVETDRAAVVLSGAWADALLENLLKAIRKKSDGTFNARINRVHEHGLINAEFQAALHSLRELRNEFAHNVAKPGNLLAGEHLQHVNRFLDVFQNSPIWAGYCAQLGLAPSSTEPIPQRFRTSVGYLLARIQRLVTWVCNGEVLSAVGLFPSALPPLTSTSPANAP